MYAGQQADNQPHGKHQPRHAQKALPKYLTETEAVTLLSHIQSDFYTRDYCIITLFLNCGMRLAELVTINMGDFRDDTIRITGKGNKSGSSI